MKKSQIAKQLILGREITPKRMVNFLRNHIALKQKKTTLPGYPSIMMIEPTNLCNLQCPLCPTGSGAITAPRGFMKFENFKKIIDECGNYLLNVTLWNWGEPFMNKDIFNMIEYAKAKKIFVRVSTNGHLLRDTENIERLVRSGLDELIFSLDGASEETFLKYRKTGDFNNVRKNLQTLVETKKRLKSRTPFVELQFIVMSHNEHEIPKIRQIVKEVGIDHLKIKTVSLEGANALGFGGDKEKIKVYIPKDEKYSRYKEGMIRKQIKDGCVRLWHTSVVNWDGSISPCCNDPNRNFVFGNVFEEGFKKAWNSTKYVNFRKAMLTNKTAIPMCKNCSGDLMGLDVE
ncbi:MAG: radical SAM protein [Nanoarchaeota archaeon]|nr:radical SAM protein [Nanoarchaeota archaeon]